VDTIPQFEAGGSHYEVGLAMGRRFAQQVHRFFDGYDFLQERLLPFYRSPAGRDLYQSFLAQHRTHFAGYVAELEGMAQGAARPFEELFLVNLRGELGGLMALRRPKSKGCADCLVLTPQAALIGHNEDGSPAARDNLFLARLQVDANPTFTVLCYPGFLPGNALGFNAAGMVHTVDAVSPRRVRVGLARHFIARSLLDARSATDAIRRVTVPGRAAGFTYNVGSLSERRVFSVEVSPERQHVHEVRGHYVHTNHYLHLAGVAQGISASSRARLARARALCQATPPASAAHVLALLGDQANRDYPIYRRATPPDQSATLCSALFDLDARRLHIYTRGPGQEPETELSLDL
jgi:hypothetical protein